MYRQLQNNRSCFPASWRWSPQSAHIDMKIALASQKERKKKAKEIKICVFFKNNDTIEKKLASSKLSHNRRPYATVHLLIKFYLKDLTDLDHFDEIKKYLLTKCINNIWMKHISKYSMFTGLQVELSFSMMNDVINISGFTNVCGDVQFFYISDELK